MGNELPTTSGILQSRNDPPQESVTAQLHNGQPQTSGPSPASGDAQSHNGPPAGSNDAHSHDFPPPSDSSDGGSAHWHGESSRLPVSYSPQDLNHAHESETPPPHAHESETLPPHALETKSLSEVLKEDLKAAGIVTALTAVTVAAIVYVPKWYHAIHHSSKPYVSAFFPPSPPDI
jgi:hypothetical protein